MEQRTNITAEQLDLFRGQRDMFRGLDNMADRSNLRIVTEPRADRSNAAGKLCVLERDIAVLEAKARAQVAALRRSWLAEHKDGDCV